MARPERADLFNSMPFPGRVCLHTSGVLFFSWRLAEKQPRHGETSDLSRYPGLALCGWWVMEKGGCALRKMKLEQREWLCFYESKWRCHSSAGFISCCRSLSVANSCLGRQLNLDHIVLRLPQTGVDLLRLCRNSPV